MATCAVQRTAPRAGRGHPNGCALRPADAERCSAAGTRARAWSGRCGCRELVVGAHTAGSAVIDGVRGGMCLPLMNSGSDELWQYIKAARSESGIRIHAPPRPASVQCPVDRAPGVSRRRDVAKWIQVERIVEKTPPGTSVVGGRGDCALYVIAVDITSSSTTRPLPPRHIELNQNLKDAPDARYSGHLCTPWRTHP